jgi:hypothetical protein
MILQQEQLIYFCAHLPSVLTFSETNTPRLSQYSRLKVIFSIPSNNCFRKRKELDCLILSVERHNGNETNVSYNLPVLFVCDSRSSGSIL